MMSNENIEYNYIDDLEGAERSQMSNRLPSARELSASSYGRRNGSRGSYGEAYNRNKCLSSCHSSQNSTHARDFTEQWDDTVIAHHVSPNDSGVFRTHLEDATDPRHHKHTYHGDPVSPLGKNKTRIATSQKGIGGNGRSRQCDYSYPISRIDESDQAHIARGCNSSFNMSLNLCDVFEYDNHHDANIADEEFVRSAQEEEIVRIVLEMSRVECGERERASFSSSKAAAMAIEPSCNECGEWDESFVSISTSASMAIEPDSRKYSRNRRERNLSRGSVERSIDPQVGDDEVVRLAQEEELIKMAMEESLRDIGATKTRQGDWGESYAPSQQLSHHAILENDDDRKIEPNSSDEEEMILLALKRSLQDALPDARRDESVIQSHSSFFGLLSENHTTRWAKPPTWNRYSTPSRPSIKRRSSQRPSKSRSSSQLYGPIPSPSPSMSELEFTLRTEQEELEYALEQRNASFDNSAS